MLAISMYNIFFDKIVIKYADIGASSTVTNWEFILTQQNYLSLFGY